MCFSPFASFSVAAGLSLMGLLSMKAAQTRTQQLLAVVPFVFAMQQAVEGIVWLSFGQTQTNASMPAVYAFLFFAFIWWPIFIPCSILWSEKHSMPNSCENRAVQIVQTLCCLMGIFTSLILVKGLLFGTTNASIIGHHIGYDTPMPNWIYVTYAFATIIPLLISRMRYVWILGLAGACSLAYSYHIYVGYTVSAWCFFTAILSAIIYLIIYLQNKKENPYSRTVSRHSD